MNELAKKNKFSSLEKPAELFLTLDPFTPESGILTATMKMKRNVAREVY
jgi:long-subunit acyl-CoA synthetase (AMP-forming)